MGISRGKMILIICTSGDLIVFLTD